MKDDFPTEVCWPWSVVATIPLVATSSASSTLTSDLCRWRAYATIGSANTCTEYCSAEAASWRVSLEEPQTGTIRATVGVPWVSVPVLSNAADFTFDKRSRAPPSLTITVARAADDMPPINDTGAPMSSGQGVATTSTSAKRTASPEYHHATPATIKEITVNGTA